MHIFNQSDDFLATTRLTSMPLEKNIGAGLLRAAQLHGTKTAFHLPDRNLSYAELGRFIVGLATVMRRHGVKRGSCVAIRMDDPRAVVIGIAASSLLGAAYTDGSRRVMHVVGEHVTHMLADAQHASDTDMQGALVVFNPEELRRIETEGVESFPGFEDETRMARVGISSGSTGQPKAIWIPAAAEWKVLSGHFTARTDVQNIVSLALFPAIATAGISQRIHTLLSGGTVVEGFTSDLFKAGTINVVKGSPAQFAALFKQLDQAGIRTKLPFAFVTGARPSSQLLGNMRERFEQIAIVYGSTEMGLIAAIPNAESEDYDGRLLPRPDVRIEIVDDEDRPLPAGVVGNIRVKSDIEMSRYFDSAIHAKAFRNGWFYTGDTGSLSEQGFLYIEGRNDDTANLGGVKVDMLLYDDFIQVLPGIDDGYSFVKPNEMGTNTLNLIIRFSAGADRAEAAKRLMDAIAAASHITTLPAAVYASDMIPRTETGKPMKHAALRLVETLQPVLVTVR